MANVRGARYWAPLGIPLFARLSRSILRGPILWLAARGALPTAGALDGGLRGDASFTIYVEARRGTEQAWMKLDGQDPYGLTARIVTYAAQQMSAPEYKRSGLLAPARALDPKGLLACASAEWGVQIHT
jgi:hypothetical protein